MLRHRLARLDRGPPEPVIRYDSGRPQSKRATVETDASSENKEQSSSDDTDNWFDSDDIQPSDSASTSAAPGHPSTSSTAADTNPARHRRMESPSQVWTANGLRGHPLVPHNGMYYRGQNPGQRSTRGQRPSCPEPNGYKSNERPIPMIYPSNSVQYPAAPNMHGIGVSGTGAQPGPQPYQPADLNGYYGQIYHYADHYQPHITRGYPLTTLPPPPPPPPPPSTSPPPKEDPDKLRLEAEIAAFKAMEERSKEGEKRKEAEARIRSEAEEAFHRRMHEMELAQEEAKKEIQKAKLEAENAARERMESERKDEEKRAEERAQAMVQAEKAAVEKLRIERESEEEKSNRLKEFAVNLEREVRAKVEMEKRAELAERDAKAKQSEDLEKLAKMKMLQSIDEIITLTKKRVLHDLTIDRESEGVKETQGWLIETRTERGTDRSVIWNGDLTGKDQLSIPRSSIPPRYAKASTVRSASRASVKLASGSPTPTWKGDHPEAPDPPVPGPPVSGSESDGDDEVTSRKADPKAFRPSGSHHKIQAYQKRNMFKRQQQQEAYHNPESPDFERLVDRIADAVIDRLMHSPYDDLLMHRHPQTSQYYRQHVRPSTNPFASAPGHYTSSKRQFGNEENIDYAPQGPPPCGPSRRFYPPPKPPHLRGRSVRGSNRSLSTNLPTHGTSPSQQRIPIPTNKRRSSILHSSPRPPLPPHDNWHDSSHTSGQFGSQTSYSEVDTITQQPFKIHRAHMETADGSEATWEHTDSWIKEVVPEAEDVPDLRKRFGEIEEDSRQAFLAKSKNKDKFQEAHKYVFKDPKPRSARVPIDASY